MLQAAFNAMITMMLAKFAMNAIPHAVGLEAPKPRWFTHSSAHWQAILSDGWIKPEMGYVPVSFDGAWFQYTYGKPREKLFVFPIGELPKYRADPVFYLGTAPAFVTEEFDGFGVMDMVCLFAMETWVLEPIPVTEKNLVSGLPPTPLIRYADTTIRELSAFAKEHIDEYFGGERWTAFEPTDQQAQVIHGYNKMVASLFGLDYSQVLSKTEERIKRVEAERGAEWWKWW